jgi:outer membrane protein OmpA-like peptidoglycan-associated protein
MFRRYLTLLRTVACLMACFTVCYGASIQDTTSVVSADVVTTRIHPLSIGISGRYLNPASTLAAFPGIPTCCDLLSPTQGWAGSIMGEYTSWISDNLGLEGALGITSATSSLASSSFVGYALDGTDENAKVIRAESETRVSLSSVSLEGRILGSWLLSNYAVTHPHLYGGISANYILSGNIEQREELLLPASAVFEDTRTNTRLVYSESVASRLQPWLTFCVGAGITPVAAERFDLRTRLSAELPLTNIVSEADKGLSYGLVRLDVSILFKSRPVIVTPPALPPVRERFLAAELRLKARSKSSTLLDTAVIDVTQALGRRVYSLLPFIFFSRGATNINEKYVQLTRDESQAYRPATSVVLADTSSASDTKATLELYYNLLNIVGRRMRVEYPNAELMIKGYCDNQGVERNNVQLSTRRAVAVRNYLRDVWQIDTSRLVIASGVLSPTAASTTMPDERDRADGHEENRRVELESSIAEVLDPVVITDTLLSITRPVLVALPHIVSDSTDHTWQLETRCAAAAAHLIEGAASPLQQYVLDSAMCPVTGGRDQSEIVSTLHVTASDGRHVDASAKIPVTTTTRTVFMRRTDGDTIQYRFRLTQFQYNNQRMLAAQSSIIQRYITPLLPGNASVQIYGYTDRKGPAELNLKLAQDRVRETQSAFTSTQHTTTLAVGEGTDIIKAPFDNATPEGRLYNRTVEIIVLVPISNGR